MPAAVCVMLESDNVAVPELVIRMACTALELPTAVDGNAVVPATLIAGAPGVTATVADADPVPTELVAVTEQL